MQIPMQQAWIVPEQRGAGSQAAPSHLVIAFGLCAKLLFFAGVSCGRVQSSDKPHGARNPITLPATLLTLSNQAGVR